MLIVYLAPQPTPLFDYVDSVDGHHVARSGQVSVQDLARWGSEVVAVLPWQVLAWHQVTLPPGVGGRLNAVLGSLLEDSCLQDPNELHMVLGPQADKLLRQGGEVVVAACAKAWLRQALAPLTSAGLRVQRLVPEVCPSPSTETVQCYVMEDGAHAQTLLCTHDSVWRMPPHASALTVAHNASNVVVWAEPSVADTAARLINTPPSPQTTAQRWVQATANGWDLAKGEWAQGHGLRGWRGLQAAWRKLRFDPTWKATRRGLVLLAVVNLLGLNLWTWQVQAHMAQQQSSLTHILTTTFPQVKIVVDAPTQMRRELEMAKKNSAQAQDADLDVMLQFLSAHWPPGATPTHLDYRGGALRLGNFEPDVLQRLRQTLEHNSPYQLEVQGAQAILQVKGTP
jgi:general secretion pathway protein L